MDLPERNQWQWVLSIQQYNMAHIDAPSSIHHPLPTCLPPTPSAPFNSKILMLRYCFPSPLSFLTLSPHRLSSTWGSHDGSRPDHRRACGGAFLRVITASMFPCGSLVATYTSLSKVLVTGLQGMKCRLGMLRNTLSTWSNTGTQGRRSGRNEHHAKPGYLRDGFHMCSHGCTNGLFAQYSGM